VPSGVPSMLSWKPFPLWVLMSFSEDLLVPSYDREGGSPLFDGNFLAVRFFLPLFFINRKYRPLRNRPSLPPATFSLKTIPPPS